jgi:hypothetical protein
MRLKMDFLKRCKSHHLLARAKGFKTLFSETVVGVLSLE